MFGLRIEGRGFCVKVVMVLWIGVIIYCGLCEVFYVKEIGLIL